MAAVAAFISLVKIINVFEKPCAALLNFNGNTVDDVFDYFKDTNNGQFRPYSNIAYQCSLQKCGICSTFPRTSVIQFATCLWISTIYFLHLNDSKHRFQM